MRNTLDQLRRPLPYIILLAIISLGCYGTSVQFYTTRYGSWRDTHPPRVVGFERGETPTIVVNLGLAPQWGEKVGTVSINDAVTGRKVHEESRFMRSGYRYAFTAPNLSRGSYMATLSSEGIGRYHTNFDMR